MDAWATIIICIYVLMIGFLIGHSWAELETNKLKNIAVEKGFALYVSKNNGDYARPGVEFSWLEK